MRDGSTLIRFVKLDKYPGFEICDGFPHTIRNIETKDEVILKETTSGFIAKFDKDTK